MLKPNIKLVGDKELIAKFQRLEKAAQGHTLVKAATAGILPIQNAAIRNAPWKSGTLSRSIHTETLEARQTYAEVTSGTNVKYAARQEFGFMQADRLGRHYNQPARPYMRPAFDNQKSASENETKAALTDLIVAAAK